MMKIGAPRKQGLRVSAVSASFACLCLLLFTQLPSRTKVHEISRHYVEKKVKSSVVSPDRWKQELLNRLEKIQIACGTLCNLNSKADIEKYQLPPENGAHFGMLHIPYNCPALLQLEEIDALDVTFPGNIPDEVMSHFSLNGSVEVAVGKIWKLPNIENRTLVWGEETIEEGIRQAKKDALKGTYGFKGSRLLKRRLQQVEIENKSILVIGSETPWVEQILLSLGAAKVTTLEYAKIVSNHTKVFTETPDTFRRKYEKGLLENFDGVVTHSSLEHAGLGRYGDALNPWADLLAVARAWCVTKKGGFLYIGEPTGKDTLLFNAHRIYGRIRWPLLTANWRQIPLPDHSVGGKLLDRKHNDAPIYGGWGFMFEK